MMNYANFVVQVISDNSVLIIFDDYVDPMYAEQISYYTLTPVNPISFTPSIKLIKQYETSLKQYLVEFSDPIKYGSYYSMTITNLPTKNNNLVNSSTNFRATVIGGPIVLGAFFSRRGCIDIVFDRPVNSYSDLSSAFIRDEISMGEQMTIVPSGTESIPVNNVRFEIPNTVITSDNWYVDFVGITDISGNYINSWVKVSAPDSIPRPLSFASATTLQIIDVSSLGYNISGGYNTVKVYFNFALDFISVTDQLNWSARQINLHLIGDDYNYIISPDATDITSLCVLLNEYKLRFNLHTIAPQVHKFNDRENLITISDCNDQTSAYQLLSQIYSKYISHFNSEKVHKYIDCVNFPPTFGFTENDLPSLLIAANAVKSTYNEHITSNCSVPVSNPIIYQNNEYNKVDNDHCWFVELPIQSSSQNSEYLILGSISSSDLGSTTNPLDYTGQIECRSVSDNLRVMTTKYDSLNSIVLCTDRELCLSQNHAVLHSQSNELSVTLKLKTSFLAAFKSLNEMWSKLDTHRLFQSHVNVDPNPIVNSYLHLNESSFIDSVKDFANHFNAHVSSSIYHGIPDYNVLNIVVDDVDSAIRAVENLKLAFNKHTLNGTIHIGDSQYLLTLPIFDQIEINPGDLKIDQLYTIYPQVTSQIISSQQRTNSYQYANTQIFTNFSELSGSFIGSGSYPCLSSALVIPAISKFRENTSFTSDVVRVFFSKRMNQQDLSNLIISGNGIIMSGKSWISDFVAEIKVNNMESLSYDLSASGLLDIAGNQVQ